MGTTNKGIFPYLTQNLENKGIFYIPLFDPKFRGKNLSFDQKQVEVRQKLSHLANLTLVRDFHSQK